MTDTAKVILDLEGRLADVESQRLRRENQRLGKQIGDLREEMGRLRAIQRLDGQLLDRERSMRAKLVRELRTLLAKSTAPKIAAEHPDRTPGPDNNPGDEIPSFLRSGDSYGLEAAGADDSTNKWFGRLLRK